MKEHGLQYGDEAYVSVRINKELVMDIVISAISKNEVAADAYGGADVDHIAVREALCAALGVVDYALQQPRLKEMLRKRIEELKKESEEGEWENPPPPSTDELPF